MERNENRQDPRLQVRIPVRCDSAEPGYRTLGLTQNVSRSGLLIEAPELLARGTTTRLRLLTGDRIAEAEAVVVWTLERSAGQMGMRLTRMSEADSIAWEQLLAFQGGPTPRASVRIALDLEITCVVGPDSAVTGRMENLSDGGLLVVLPRAIPPQTHVRVVGPAWISLPPIDAEVVWVLAGTARGGIMHGLRVLSDEKGEELFRIGTILRILIG